MPRYEMMFGVPPSGSARYIAAKFNRYVVRTESTANEEDPEARNRRVVQKLVVYVQRLLRGFPIMSVTQHEFDLGERVVVSIPRSHASSAMQPK